MYRNFTASLAVLFALAVASVAHAGSGGTPAIDRAAAAVRAAAPNGDPASEAAALRVYIHRHVQPDKPILSHPQTAETVLADGAGPCGNQTQAYLAVAARLGLTARPVEFYERPSDAQRASHIAPEVFWGGRWHLEDITWNTVYRATLTSTPLSAAAVMQLTPKAREKARRTGVQAFPWVMSDYRRNFGDPFAYIHSAADIVVDHVGTYTVNLATDRFPGDNIPGYIGRALSEDGTIGNLRLHLTNVPDGDLTIVGVSACTAGTLIADSAVRDSAAVVDGAVVLKVSGGTVDLSVDSVGVCYIAVQQIR